MSGSKVSDPFKNIINSFKDIRFIDSDSDSCLSQNADELSNVLQLINLDESAKQKLIREKRPKNKVLDSNNEVSIGYDKQDSPYFEELDSPGKVNYCGSLKYNNATVSSIKTQQSVNEVVDRFSMADLLPCLESKKKSKRRQKKETKNEVKQILEKKKELEPKMTKKFRTNANLPTNQIRSQSLEKLEFSANEHSDSSSKNQKPSSFFLFANPANFFYKKMGNERHYYISQIANGSTGIFLEKPDWKIEDDSFKIQMIKDSIYKRAQRIVGLLISNKITMQNLNNMKIEQILAFSEEDQAFEIPNKISEQLNCATDEFEEYISKNVYGKKQHSYKIPNAEELQKQLIIPKNYNSTENISRIYLRVCLRVLFEQFFNDKNLYELLIDKIIDHVKDEVEKNRKDHIEKLPELKKIFYKANREEFSQKFLDPPADLKNLKANFNYGIPVEKLKDLFVDFLELLNKLQPSDILSEEKLDSIFISESIIGKELKNSQLWIAMPFNNEVALSNTQKVLANREIPTFKATSSGEKQEWQRKNIMEIWFENGKGNACLGSKSDNNKIEIEGIENKGQTFGAYSSILLKKVGLNQQKFCSFL